MGDPQEGSTTRGEGLSHSRGHQHRQCFRLTQDKSKNYSSDCHEALARHPPRLLCLLLGCERSSSKSRERFARSTKPKILQNSKFKIQIAPQAATSTSRGCKGVMHTKSVRSGWVVDLNNSLRPVYSNSMEQREEHVAARFTNELIIQTRSALCCRYH